MSSSSPEAIAAPPKSCSQGAGKLVSWASVLLSVALVVWFYGFETRYDSGRGQSAFRWIYSAWNGETDYEHGLLFPFVIAGLIFYRLKDLRAAAGRESGWESGWGLLAVLVGVLFYVAAYRTLQPRIAMAGLPFIVWGGAWYLWGWRVAKLLTFPLFSHRLFTDPALLPNGTTFMRVTGAGAAAAAVPLAAMALSLVLFK